MKHTNEVSNKDISHEKCFHSDIYLLLSIRRVDPNIVRVSTIYSVPHVDLFFTCNNYVLALL